MAIRYRIYINFMELPAVHSKQLRQQITFTNDMMCLSPNARILGRSYPRVWAAQVPDDKLQSPMLCHTGC